MDTIAFPIRFDSTGLVKHRRGSDPYLSQLLTLAILTEPGRHPLGTDYGIWDPTFTSLDKGKFVIQAAHYVPEVVITAINSEINFEGQIAVSFGYRKRK
jgi:hypothetical protein